MRIIHCLRAPVGGLFRHVRDLAAEQAARGHAVGVVCDAATGDALTEDRLASLSPHLAIGLLRTPMSRDVGLDDIAAYRAVRGFALENRAGILHGHGAKGGAYARLAARALRRAGSGTACLYTPHGGSLHYHPASLRGRIYMALERRLGAFTDGIVFESAYARRIYETQVGVPACCAQVIANGLQEIEFSPIEPAADAADFLFVGELRQLKGVDVLIEAVAGLAGMHQTTVAIVGQGPDERRFRERIATLGLESRIHLLGAMPARQAFRRGRCMLVPSRAESLPYIVLEAAAAGLPMIATDVGGIPEIVAGTDTALVEPGNVEALTDAMLAFLADEPAARARAGRLRAAVRQKFSLAAMATAVLALYDECRG